MVFHYNTFFLVKKLKKIKLRTQPPFKNKRNADNEKNMYTPENPSLNCMGLFLVKEYKENNVVVLKFYGPVNS